MVKVWALALLGFSALPLCAAEAWVKVTTPHFELYTNSGEKKAREAILYFEQVRSFFLEASPAKRAPDLPVRIIAFRSEKDYKPYRINEFADAFYTGNQSRDYIVMRDLASEHYPTAIHEYTHLIIRHAKIDIPVWLNEGWAELYSTLRPNGKKAVIGDMIPGRVQTLLSSQWIDLPTLTSVEHNSPLYNERDKAGMFYAESWALMHMLYLSPEYGNGFGKFVRATAGKKTADEAGREAYGKSLLEIERDLRAYLKRTRLYGAVFDVKLEKSSEEPVTTSPEPFEVDLVLADLLSASGKREQARTAYERLAANTTGRPEIDESLGYLKWSAQDTDGARQHFSNAMNSGSKNAQMCFHYAMLERSGGREDAAVTALRRAVDIKPDYTEARLQLGLAELNARNWTGALDDLLKIRKIDPEQAPWLFNGIAQANMQLGKRDEARKNAELALKWSKTPDQTNIAQQLIRYLDAQQEYERRPAAVAVVEPIQPAPAAQEEAAPALPPQNPFVRSGETLSRAEGIAKALDCKGKRAELRVQVGDNLMAFAIDDPARIFVKHGGAGSFDFTCGPQKPFRVTVEFVPQTGGRIAGMLRGLEF